ncbi:MAG: NAD(P)-dependent oxidoreductase, partial [Agathobacter sp.]|nr:NAD(P)-dependent oxidoreductase [Agathobacter sp.]
NRNEEIEVAVVRMPQVYGACADAVAAGVCANYLEAFAEEIPIMLNTNKAYGLMYIDDAVEAIYRILNVDGDRLKHLYHIAPAKHVTEKDIYNVLSKLCNKKPQLINQNALKEEIDVAQRFISTTQESLGFREKFSVEDGLGILYKQYATIEKKQEDQKRVENVGENRKLFLPIIETLVAFLVVQIFMYVTQTAAFHNVVDVYLVFTLIVAVVLGAMPATLAVVLSVMGKYNILLMEGNVIDIFTQYENYLWVLQLFALSVLTGYVRDRYNRISTEMKSENAYLKEELESIKAINDSNVEVKEVFENRLANYKDSYVKVYEIISQLDDLESKAIIFKAATVVADIMKSKDVAIYTYEENSGFCRLMASTSELAKGKGKSLRLSDYVKVEECLRNKNIYMNREFDEKMPMYAVGTYNEDRLEVVTMIWDMDLENVNLHQSNLLSMLGKLLERSMSRALRYMDSIKTSTYVQGTSVMEADAFHQMLDIYCTGESQGLLEYTLLEVVTKPEEKSDLYSALKSITR